ncbi:MAG TPA: allantoinase AllB [Streptosporangiaceae bacterium]|jgi:allantoinase|nr:allantoinase AllB [Streptosporangiaceae bacterium]
MVDLIIHAPRAVTPQGEVPASVVVRDGRISRVAEIGHQEPASEVIELGPDEVLLPGLVDSHVHVNEPGHADWEGFTAATRAAAAGGITTLIDMPLDSVPLTTDTAALAAKRAAAAGQCFVDVGFWGGAVPGNLDRLPALHRAGVLGFKCFLADSGSPDFPLLPPAALRQALGVLRDLDAVLLVHAESEAELAAAPRPAGRSYAAFLASRPPRSEEAAVAAVLDAARETGGRVHIVHVSSASALPMIAAARRDGVQVTAETCPHYLALAAEDIPDGATEYACCPPVRDAANRELLWQALADGTLDLVVSDHSPCPPQLKHLHTGDFAAAWGGISSLQISLPVVWTQARQRGLGLADIACWMSEGPARLADLPGKGRIAAGYDADLCAFAPEEEFTVMPEALHHKHPLTPYAGHTLHGVVRRTWLRGHEAGSSPAGRLILKGQP